ncbi:hypothetical protein M9Y10_036001 [Tritrichomonas musculus]|uniref:Beta-lactamase n=1 Tax=Tritrichomonas musculus TaxID=1915356 RepID=A0ABR2GWL3_9EUKA
MMFELGLGIPKDFLKALYYYNQSKIKVFYAYKKIGDLYKKGLGVSQNYRKAKKKYKKGAKKGDRLCFYSLGKLYEKGKGVEQNYLKSKKYYEQSSYRLYSKAIYKLGYLYENGYGVQRDYKKAFNYYDMSAYLENPEAFYHLGCLYSNGDILDININKAIDLLQKCSKIIVQYIQASDICYKEIRNNYFRNSQNDLGLIYLIEKNDINKAYEFILQAALAEYPFAQNNLGLFYKFYSNKNDKVEHFFNRSAEHKFSLAEFNLGQMREKEGKMKESVEYYIRASEHEDEPLVFHSRQYHDKRLEISKTFVICYTNLKLSDYFYILENLEESKKYFIKSFSKLNIIITNDLSKENPKTFFSNLRHSILNFPKFNLRNQSNLSNEIKQELQPSRSQEYLYHKKLSNDTKNSKEIFIDAKKTNLEINREDVIIDDIGQLFDFIIGNNNFKIIFNDEIKKILDIMEKIIFTPPYPILFGRINIAMPKPKKNKNLKEINALFYEGLGLDELRNNKS